MKNVLIYLSLISLITACGNKPSKKDKELEVVEINIEEVKQEEKIYPPPPPPPPRPLVKIKFHDLNSKMQGKWQSVDDAKNVVEFKGFTKIEYYDGEKLDENAFVLKQDTLETVYGDKLQYLINYVAADRLELIYLDKGKSLNFKKIR